MRVFTFAMASIGLLSGCVADHRAPHTTDGGVDDNCTSVEHDVSVRNMNDASGLPQTQCWDLYGKLTVEGSTITTLSMLGDIRSANDIEIVGTGLTSFDTKSPVNVWYGEIKVASNTSLKTLNNLTIQDGHVASVFMDQNAALTSFELGGLDNIDSDLTVTNNAALTTVDISTLSTVGGKVAIDNNAALQTVGLGSLSQANGVELINNTAMTAVHGLPTTTIYGDLIMQGNAALTTVSGLTSLQSIRGMLKIDSNKALMNLDFIPTTSAAIEGQLYVTNNAAITDMGGLSHFNYIAGITITGNTSLAYCPAHEVTQCVTTYTGTPIISNNKSGTTTNCTYWCN